MNNTKASVDLIEFSIEVKILQKKIKILDELIKSYEQEYFKDKKRQKNVK